MKLFLIIMSFLLLGLTVLSAFNINLKKEKSQVTGYFADRNHSISAMVSTPQINSSATGCDGGCLTTITFSQSSVPAITVKDCIGGELTNLGDLDGDGLDEMGFLPGWFAGCWHNYRVYTYKSSNWQLAVPPFPTHCNEFEAAGIKPIIKDVHRPGYVLVTCSVFKGNDIVFKTVSERIK